MEDFDEIMKALGAETGLDGLAPDSDGIYDLEIDGHSLSLCAPAGTGTFVVWAAVGSVPPEGRRELYEQLLRAMYRLRETDGARFSILRETESLVLQRADRVAGLDVERLVDALDSFVGVLADWRRRVADFRPHEGGDDESSFLLGQDGFMRI